MIDLQRFLLIYVVHSIISIIFFIVAIKILKRNRNQLTYSLSAFYFSIVIGLIINAIYILLKINPHVFILHSITVFFILFGQFFLVMFSLSLYKLESHLSSRKIVFFTAIYSILVLCILAIPDGYAINENTNWKPVWTWSFLIIVYIFMACFTIFPFIILFFKIYKTFMEKELKRKLMYFFIGCCGMTISMYGGMLYNTWDNVIFRLIWSICVLFIVIPSGILIYYGIGFKLK